jgi:aldose 1-epimerase
MKKEIYGTLPDRKEAWLFTLKNINGIEIKITNYGGIVTSIVTPDKNGSFSDIVLGLNKLEDYLDANPYLGATIGRFANRIKEGKFSLGGKDYCLAKNDGNNHLHGGYKGFDKILWNHEIINSDGKEILKLNYISPDGEESYPGNLNVSISFSINDKNELSIDYLAKTDMDTIINLTNHSYFNLSGEETILNHELRLNADKFTPIDNTLIPTGELRSVENTPFDFRKSEKIGKRINDEHDQLKYGNGYDHNFVLNKNKGTLVFAAEVFDPLTGRTLEVFTTEPGIQFYSGNFLDGSITGKSGKKYLRRGGLCLETQHFPDSRNRPEFPSVVLKQGEEYKTTTIYKFSVK